MMVVRSAVRLHRRSPSTGGPRALTVCALLASTAYGQLLSAPQNWSDPVTPPFYGVGYGPVAIDMNGDSRLDLVYGASVPNGDPRLRLNNGALGFSPPINLDIVESWTIGSTPIAGCYLPAAVTDFNGDGMLDLAFTSPNLVRPLSVGLARLGAPYTFDKGPELAWANLYVVGWSEHVSFCDLDGDGLTEIVCAGPPQLFGSPEQVRVLRWDVSSSSFVAAHTTVVPQGNPLSVVAGDFNGDGVIDVAYESATTPGYGSATLHLLVGGPGLTFTSGGATSFTSVTPIPGHSFSYGAALAAGDVDRDGFDDVVGVGVDAGGPGTLGGVFLFRGGAAGFGAPTFQAFLGGGSWPGQGPHEGANVRASLVDVDLDGFPELIAPHGIGRIWPPGASTTAVDPTGGGPYASFNLGWPGYLGGQIAADFDADGDADVVVPSFFYSATGYPTGNIGIAWNRTRLRTGCTGAPSPPTVATGSLYLGNPAFEVRIDGAPPNALAALGISTAPGYQPFPPCVVGLDLGGLLQPTTSGLGFSVTDASGSASQYFSIPAVPSMLFATYYGQWIVVDPAGPLTSGGVGHRLTETRTFVIW